MERIRHSRVGKWNGQALLHVNDEPFFWWEAGAVSIAVPDADWFDLKKSEPCLFDRAREWRLNVIELTGIHPRTLPAAEASFDGLFGQIDEMIDRIVESGAYAFMRIELDNPLPAWYAGAVAEAQDGQLAEYAKVECRASLHDPYFLNYACLFIEKVVSHYAAHPFVLGFTPVFGCCNQCSYPNFQWFDFAAVALHDFQQWLAQRYTTAKALNERWHTRYPDFRAVTFDRLRAQDLDRAETPEVVDFKQFRCDTLHLIRNCFLGGCR